MPLRFPGYFSREFVSTMFLDRHTYHLPSPSSMINESHEAMTEEKRGGSQRVEEMWTTRE